jgi:quercetin dioxygenase-like cupin family protein
MPHGEQEGGDAMGAEHDWTWPPSMDAVVAAPGSHRVLFENDDVRVLEVTIAAGHREPEHTHRDPSVMIVDGPARIRYYQGDTLTFSSPPDPVPAGTRASWMAPEGPHSVENVDDHPYHAIRVELKTRGRARPSQ